MMPAVKIFFVLFIPMLIVLWLGQPKANAQMQKENFTQYDTVFVYDTIIVYDTIWTEELVYDTVWVYDTIRAQDSFEMKGQLSAQYTSFFSDLDGFYDSIQQNKIQIESDSKTEARWLTSNKSRQTPRKSKLSSSFLNTPYRLTLNPFKGSFDASIYKNGRWGLGLYGGVVYHLNTKVEEKTFAPPQIENVSHIPLGGFETGMKLNYQLAQLLVQTGVGMVNIKEDLEYRLLSYRRDTTMEKRTIYKKETFSDTTIQYYWGETYPDNDSVYFYIHKYDSLVPYDSIYPVIDSVRIETAKKEQLNHYLLEVPLLFSWQFGTGRVKMGLKAGGVNQFHLYSSGRSFNQQGELLDVNEVVSLMKYNFALYGGVDLMCHFSDKFDFGLEAYYKYPFRSFAESAYQSHHKPTYGLNISVGYRF